MVYELKDFSKVKHLIGDWNVFDVVDVEIKAFVTDPDAPRSALLYSSFDGIFLAGEPDRELVEYSVLAFVVSVVVASGGVVYLNARFGEHGLTQVYAQRRLPLRIANNCRIHRLIKQKRRCR